MNFAAAARYVVLQNALPRMRGEIFAVCGWPGRRRHRAEFRHHRQWPAAYSSSECYRWGCVALTCPKHWNSLVTSHLLLWWRRSRRRGSSWLQHSTQWTACGTAHGARPTRTSWRLPRGTAASSCGTCRRRRSRIPFAPGESTPGRHVLHVISTVHCTCHQEVHVV